MEADKIALTYATSLVELAEEKGAFADVAADMEGIGSVISQDTSLIDVLESPSVKQDAKISMIDKIFKGQVHEITLNFLKVLVGNRRQGWLPAIVRVLGDAAIQKGGQSKVEVSYAKESPGEIKTSLVSSIEKKLGTKVLLQETHDPSLIGGMVIKFGDIQIDASIKRQLNQLKAEMSDLKLQPSDYISE